MFIDHIFPQVSLFKQEIPHKDNAVVSHVLYMYDDLTYKVTSTRTACLYRQFLLVS